MIKLKMKNCSMILIEKLQKYEPNHHPKLTSKNILQVKKYYLLIYKKRRSYYFLIMILIIIIKKIEQGKFTYSLFGKAFEKKNKTIENQGKKIH